MKKDVLIVGAGPAGIFTALEMLRCGSKEKILIVEKGRAIENRSCPKSKIKSCVNCKPYCHITTGFSGAGAFSDGKLSLSSDVGGDLPNLIGEQKAQDMINYVDSIYLEFGADTHVEGVSNPEAVKEIRKRAIKAGLKLVDCPIRHLGTEKAQDIYYAIEQYLLNNGVEIMFGFECTNLILKDNVCMGAHITDGKVEYDRIVYFEKDLDGRITALKTNMTEVNRLKTDILDIINGEILALDSSDIGVPLGSIFLPELVSGRGPAIPVHILAIRNADANFVSHFSQAGINQTLHQVLMEVSIDVSVLVLGETASFTMTSEVVVAETVIVGTVPDTYLHTLNPKN